MVWPAVRDRLTINVEAHLISAVPIARADDAEGLLDTGASTENIDQ
jgi:hypothetical protein